MPTSHALAFYCLLTLCLVSRVRSARGEVEGKLPEGGEYGAGTWRRSRIMQGEHVDDNFYQSTCSHNFLNRTCRGPTAATNGE